MKTQKQAQKIFDVLISELGFVSTYNLLYASKNYVRWSDASALLPPLEHYLKQIKIKLKDECFDEAFFKSVYAEAFYTGPIPKGRNHILITCERQIKLNPRSSALRFWVDLDKVAIILNAYLHIDPPYLFKVNYNATEENSTRDSLTYKVTTAVNSVNHPNFAHNIFLFSHILTAQLSVMSFLTAAFALLAFINLSTAGIVTAMGVGLLAGVACYGFFKAEDADKFKGIRTTTRASIESESMSIESIFATHFAPEDVDSSSKKQEDFGISPAFAI